MHAEGWYRDPYGLHGDRWFSDGRPTGLVRDQGVESHDEPPQGEPPLPLEPLPEITESDGGDLLRADDGERESEYDVEREDFSPAVTPPSPLPGRGLQSVEHGMNAQLPAAID